MALGIQQQIAGFQVSVDELSGVHVFECFQELVDNEFSMYFFQDSGSDHHV